jgi:hypothetical protein
MRALSAFVAVMSLVGAVVLVPTIIGVLLAIPLVGLAGLALVGILNGVDDRTVRQHDPPMDPTGWRDGSRQ